MVLPAPCFLAAIDLLSQQDDNGRVEERRDSTVRRHPGYMAQRGGSSTHHAIGSWLLDSHRDFDPSVERGMNVGYAWVSHVPGGRQCKKNSHENPAVIEDRSR
jgi:hypothetical protein